MKKIVVSLLLMLFSINIHAAKINKLIFFGDSLSDNGNLYSLLFHIIPKSPPYFEGRFSNGPTWAENLGKHYQNKNSADYKIYAYGGATTIFHLPTTHFVAPTNLGLELDKYILDSAFSNRSETLFSIWIGGNDYMFFQSEDPDELTTKVVDKISSSIDSLIYYGGKNFLILNLPDLSKIPSSRGTNSEAILQTFSILHNQKLAAAMLELQDKYPDVKITTIDMFETFNDVMTNPEKYNEKYHINVANLTDACWKSGPWLSKTFSADSVRKDIQQALPANHAMDVRAMSDFIISNPALLQTYQLGKSYERGNVPCANPQEYLFWDSIHPTAVVHHIVAEMIAEKLDNQMG